MPDLRQLAEFSAVWAYNPITVQGAEVAIATRHEQDYISLTDMVKSFEGGSALIEQWLKNKDTVLFLGVWEQIYNPGFNSLEFEGIRNEAGRNSFYLSAKKWIEATGAIGLHAKAGRYGGTFAHRDIAFEFGSWLSPEFKLYLIKEFQRLKDEEARATSLEWSFQRTLAKINYRIHTDAIKERLIPPQLTKAQIVTVYASEADLLNVALFGMTAAVAPGQSPTAGKHARCCDARAIGSAFQSGKHQRSPDPSRIGNAGTLGAIEFHCNLSDEIPDWRHFRQAIG